jgi:hypothetical protein
MKGSTMDLETRRVTRLSRVEQVHGPGTRNQGPSKRGNEETCVGKDRLNHYYHDQPNTLNDG